MAAFFLFFATPVSGFLNIFSLHCLAFNGFFYFCIFLFLYASWPSPPIFVSPFFSQSFCFNRTTIDPADFVLLSHYWTWLCISQRYSYLYLNLKESMMPASDQPSHVDLHHQIGSQNYYKSKFSLHAFYVRCIHWARQDGWSTSRFPVARIIAYVAHMILSISSPYTYIEWKHLSGLIQEILSFYSFMVHFIIKISKCFI